MNTKQQIYTAVRVFLNVSISILIVGCGLPNRKRINLPAQDYLLENGILKTNGYYYLEETNRLYCKKEFNGSAYSGVSGSEYEEKIIRTISLYANGAAYHSGGTFFSGINREGDLYYDYCNQLESKNNYEQAKKKFENLLKGGLSDHKRRGLDNRGVFQIKEDQIVFQIYHTASDHRFLTEYSGRIVNDTTINIVSKRTYPHPIRKVDELYKFKEYPSKPDSVSYILKNREKFGG